MFLTRISILSLLVISMAGCRNSRMVSEATRTTRDSIIYKETIRIDTLKIPADEATAIVYPDNIPADYHGIIASERQGRSTVTIYRESTGAIRAVAGCDSMLQFLFNKLTSQYEQYTDLKEQSSIQTIYRTPPWLKWIIAGMVISTTLLLTNQIRKIFS